MTEKHYKLIATVLRNGRPDGTGSNFMVWRYTVNDFTEAFAKDNPRFDEAKFREACGYEVL